MHHMTCWPQCVPCWPLKTLMGTPGDLRVPWGGEVLLYMKKLLYKNYYVVRNARCAGSRYTHFFKPSLIHHNFSQWHSFSAISKCYMSTKHYFAFFYLFQMYENLPTINHPSLLHCFMVLSFPTTPSTNSTITL